MAVVTLPQRNRECRPPTGRPNPPLILITGAEKTGKSYQAAKGSGSPLVGATYWIEIGGTEGTADYYGRVPGARYKIVPHDGSFQDILDAIRWVNHQPRVDGLPNMLVIDTMTSLWDMLSDEIALYARRRAVAKANRNRTRIPTPDDPVVIDTDLWNRAKDRWGMVLWLLRRHQGPCLLIARTEIVTHFENDKPTKSTIRKVKAEKNLPAAVDAIVDLHTVGEAWLTGVRSLHMDIQPGESQRLHNFSVDTLLRNLGLQDAVETRSASELSPDPTLDEQGPAMQTVREPGERPALHLNGEQVAQMIREALMHPSEPETALRNVREEHGRRALRAVETTTGWGVMSADDLITRSLQHLAEKAEEAGKEDAGSPAGETTTGRADGDGEKVPDRPDVQETDAAAEETPPPPDPTDEPPVPERYEEYREASEAEEPQDLPRRRPVPSKQAKVVSVLLTEAEIQARVLGVTAEEHLAPVTGPDGAPPAMTALRAYVVEHRPAVISLLEARGERDIAAAYGRAGKPELKIAEMFSALYADIGPHATP
ncbi:hypothetical protein ACWD4V_00770 [Streptomyces tsukubensis]